MANKLFYGPNFDVLRNQIDAESVDHEFICAGAR